MANEGPFKAHLDAAQVKFDREQEEEVMVTLKGKHLSVIRRLLFPLLNSPDKNAALCREIDQIIYEAAQRI